MKLSDEFKVGLLATFGLIIAIFGYGYIKGYSLFSDPRFFYGIYNRVDGLNVADPVLVNGYRVGRVESIQMKNYETAEILVKMRMEKDVKIPVNSSAELISSDLLGEKAIDITLGDAEELAEPQDTLISSTAKSLTQEVSDQMLPVKAKAEELFSSIDSLVGVVGVILKQSDIQQSFTNINSALKKFENVAVNLDTLVVSQTQNVDKILTNVESITANIDRSDEQITNLISNIEGISDSLNQANIKQLVNNLSMSVNNLAEVLDSVNNGQGTVAALIQERELYDNINRTVTDLDSLLIDIKENPGHYVNISLFGGRKKKSD